MSGTTTQPSNPCTLLKVTGSTSSMLSSGPQLSSPCPHQHPEGSWAPPAALQHSHAHSLSFQGTRNPVRKGTCQTHWSDRSHRSASTIWPLILPSEKRIWKRLQPPSKPQIFLKLHNRFNIWNALYCQKKSISINYVILSNGSFCLFPCSKFAEALAPTAHCQNTREERMTRKEKEERRAKT